MTDPLARLTAALADRYRLERELGAGGMATVYLAHDLRHDRKVAIKVLKPDLAAVLGAERFVTEIKTTAALQHPHILPLFDSGSADGFLFYVMPYVEGETLRGKLDRERQLGVAEAVRIAREVADALDYAHRHGVVHRDIKPENILLHDGRATVADFGIALAVSAAAGGRMTETGLSLGTPHYMSPEQATAEREITGRSDTYSLGCVLYEMLTGNPPHTGATAQQIIMKIVTEEAAPVTNLRKAVPDHVAAAVAQALEKLPADRFESVGAFSAALTESGRVLPRAPANSSTGAGRRQTLGFRTWVLVALALATGIALGAGAWRAREDGAGEVLHLPIALQNPPRSRSTWATGVRISPDGRRMAYYTNSGWQVTDLATGASHPVSREVVGLGLVFSPSSDSVALTTTSRHQQIYISDLATGRASRVVDCCSGLGDWDRSGWLYHRDDGFNLVRTNLDGRREVLHRLAAGQREGLGSLVSVGDGQAILFVRSTSPDPALAEVVAKTLPDGEVRTLMRGVEVVLTASDHLLVVQADGRLLAARFDRKALALRESPLPVLEDLEVRVQMSGLQPNAPLSISRDGTLLFVRRGAVSADTVITVDRRGRLLRVEPTWGGWVNQVARSPRGDRWAVSVHRGLVSPNIWVRGGQSEGPRRLTFSLNLDYFPRFLQGGDAIAYAGYEGLGRTWDLYRIPFDGSAPPTLLLDTPGDIQQPRFSRDERWVAFCERDAVGGTDILAHRFLPDSTTITLVGTPAFECSPDISPDGQWLVYESAEGGSAEVYVRPFRGATEARWQITGGSAGTAASGPIASIGAPRTPRWSASGRELFYVNDRRELVAVPVRTIPTFAFGEPEILFPLDDRTDWSGEVLLGDEEFLLLRRKREAPGQVVMIRNFHRLLREKFGG